MAPVNANLVRANPVPANLVHATCVAVDGVGVLIRGTPGSGKSDLALRLIDGGAVLVADDYCEVAVGADGSLSAAAPSAIAGRIEMRGFGLVRLPHAPSARIGLVVDLCRNEEIDRLPERTTTQLHDRAVPWMRLDAFAASAAAKVRFAVRAIREGQTGES
ncbi:MAG: HPr kinase/phosphatase C-terminal domain-containing protein [Rhodospirillaceae bacterium]|nr:HPr kinase/phosphatase C-terminal domain-containing protein [Rhodospirillaceae bacterium]